MGRSRRRLSRPKVRVGLPKKKPGVFKPAFTIPKELLSLETSSPFAGGGEEETKRVWDNKGSYLRNYRAFGVVANPNLLSVRARTPAIVQSADLQLPNHDVPPVSEFDSIENGSDLEAEGSFVAGQQRENNTRRWRADQLAAAGGRRADG